MTKSTIYTCMLLLILSTTRAETQTAPDSIQQYQYPRLAPKANDFKVKANGKDIFVYQTSAAPFAAFGCNGPVKIEVEMPSTSDNVQVSPLRLGIGTTINGRTVTFTLPHPMNVALKINDMPQLYLYANALEGDKPDTGSVAHYFKAGQVYEVGELNMTDNERMYIEAGAIVRGCIRATGAKNISIGGYGVFDGGYYKPGSGEERSIVLRNCSNSIIEHIIMIEPSSWMIVLGGCTDITVDDVKELGFVSTSDGVDIVGSKHIRVKNCIFRNGDDCIAIKAMELKKHGSFCNNVDDVEVSGCTFVAYSGGHALEIGHELQADKVSNIRFTNCDIMGVHGFGGIFGIHNTDRAEISQLLYDDIRVEHYYNKLIDMRIVKSRYFKDEMRGKAHDIVFRNVVITVSKYNPGYSFSIIGGYDAKHPIRHVTFDNVTLNGVKVTNADQLDLFTKQTEHIQFK